MIREVVKIWELCRVVKSATTSKSSKNHLPTTPLQHYALPENGAWTGCHCEGGIWSTLFALLLWDEIFAPVPDVFRTPFQTAPLDLRTEGFYMARKVGQERLRDGMQMGTLREGSSSKHPS